MSRYILAALCIGLFCLSSANASAQNPDLFPLSSVNVTFFSPLISSCFNISSLFLGGPNSTCPGEGQDVIFADQSQGSVNTVQFSTSSSVTVSAVRQYAGGDGPPNNFRDLQQFSFAYESSPGVYTTILTYSPTHPEPSAFVFNLSSPVTAQNFQGQYTQYGTGGPRVAEIDAFANPIGVPTLAPASLNDGGVLLGSTSKGKTTVLTNTSGVPMNIFAITPSADYSETDTCSVTLAPGDTCSITVTITPTVSGAISGVLTIDDDVAGTPHIVALSGSGLFLLTAGPSSLNFGDQPVGSTSTPQTISITNNTSSSQGFAFVPSANYAAFGSGTKPCNGTLAAKAKCTVSVTFSPTQNGPVAGVLAVSGNNFPTQFVALTGTGTGASTSPLTFSPASIPLPSTLVGKTSKSVPATVTNVSGSDLDITNMQATTDYSVTGSGTTPCGGVLKAGTSCGISVSFSPEIPSKTPGALALMDNSSVGTQVVSLSGSGLNLVSFKPASLTFSTQAVGTSSAPKTLTISNNQSSILGSLAIAASGNYSVAPGIKNPCSTSLAAGASCTIAVTFTPTNKGVIKGALTISHNASGSPQAVGLTGTGQ